jgi:prevent-host-death family protein
MPMQKGAEEARAKLPELLDAAERGEPTIITKRGKPVAAIVSIEAYRRTQRQASLLSLVGTMKGYWGEDSTGFVGELRDEWER